MSADTRLSDFIAKQLQQFQSLSFAVHCPSVDLGFTKMSRH